MHTVFETLPLIRLIVPERFGKRMFVMKPLRPCFSPLHKQTRINACTPPSNVQTMKTILSAPLLSIMICWMSSTTHAASETPVPGVPAVVELGLKKSMYGSLKEALDVWYSKPPLATSRTPEKRQQRYIVLARLENGLGRVVDFRVLGVDQLSDRERTVWATVYYDHGSIHLRVQCYHDGPDWTVSEYSFHTNPERIFPADLMTQASID